MTRLRLGLTLCLALWARPAATAQAGVEQRLQAALVFKLSRFVEWPASRLPEGRGPFRICLVGRGPLAAALQELEGRKIKGHPVKVLIAPAFDAVAHVCHLAFVDRGQRTRLALLWRRLGHAPVLTVSDLEGFAAKGGMVGIVRRGKRLGFEIDLRRARASGLTLAAPLLQISKVIEK